MFTNLVNQMPARANKIINGRKLASNVLENYKYEILKFKNESLVRPGLAIIQVGNREDSNIFIRNKVKAANYLNINLKLFKYKSSCSKAELLDRIYELNHDQSIHGIVVQLPFESKNHLNPTDFIYQVLPDKDVDGLHYINAGKVLYGNKNGDAYIP